LAPAEILAASAWSYGNTYLGSISISQCLCSYEKTKDKRKLSIAVIILWGRSGGNKARNVLTSVLKYPEVHHGTDHTLLAIHCWVVMKIQGQGEMCESLIVSKIRSMTYH